jgi:glutamate racemase
VKNIGVVGTIATIGSEVYKRKIGEIDQRINVYSKACPLFVPLVEEGWWDNSIAFEIAKEYLDDFNQNNLDALLLGCTHYPLLKGIISRVLGEKVKLISSDVEVSKTIKGYLRKNNVERSHDQEPVHRFYTSDDVKKFKELGRVILGRELEFVEKVDIEKY